MAVSFCAAIAQLKTIAQRSPMPRTTVKDRARQRGSLPNPFDRLHDVILLRIFLDAKGERDPNDAYHYVHLWTNNPVPWKLSHVCRRWRLFARQTPRLWDALPVMGFCRHSTALIKSSLELVARCPARVQIFFGSSSDEDKWAEKSPGALACQELVAAGMQIRTLFCHGLDLYWVNPILPPLHSPCLQGPMSHDAPDKIHQKSKPPPFIRSFWLDAEPTTTIRYRASAREWERVLGSSSLAAVLS